MIILDEIQVIPSVVNHARHRIAFRPGRLARWRRRRRTQQRHGASLNHINLVVVDYDVDPGGRQPAFERHVERPPVVVTGTDGQLTMPRAGGRNRQQTQRRELILVVDIYTVVCEGIGGIVHAHELNRNRIRPIGIRSRGNPDGCRNGGVRPCVSDRHEVLIVAARRGDSVISEGQQVTRRGNQRRRLCQNHSGRVSVRSPAPDTGYQHSGP